MDLQTIGIAIAKLRKAIDSINDDIADIKDRLSALEMHNCDAIGKVEEQRFVEELICSPGTREYYHGKHPMHEDP
jgi:hypothetical protein